MRTANLFENGSVNDALRPVVEDYVRGEVELNAECGHDVAILGVVVSNVVVTDIESLVLVTCHTTFSQTFTNNIRIKVFVLLTTATSSFELIK